jgi:hypothetical protein
MGYEINLNIPEAWADRLIDEASKRQITLEQLALQHIAAGTPPPPLERPNYLEIVERAHRLVSSPRSIEEIDADLQRSRDEW